MLEKIIFVSDTFHHHQKGVADALFFMTGGLYRFITTAPLREERKKMGFANAYPDYVFDASSRTSEVWAKAQQLIDGAEVVVLGSAPYKLLKHRLAEKKLTFRYSERLWKQYKHYLKTPFYMLDNWKTRGCNMLCASAFAARDYNTMGAFREHCYKWGYFPELILDAPHKEKTKAEPVKMMWCSRFLDWKHPELPIFLAKKLKDKGYVFCIEMFGSGEYLQDAVTLSNDLGVTDVVLFCGNAANSQITQKMKESDIFLFTSDRGEGWGVVANESMSCGCVLVASDEIGSVPYMVEDGKNGCTFKSSSRSKGFSRFGVSVDNRSLISLEAKVEWLIKNPEERVHISANAIGTIRDVWNPTMAAKNLLELIDSIQQGKDNPLLFGPCSNA